MIALPHLIVQILVEGEDLLMEEEVLEIGSNLNC
jgi:hypothetical protein